MLVESEVTTVPTGDKASLFPQADLPVSPDLSAMSASALHQPRCHWTVHAPDWLRAGQIRVGQGGPDTADNLHRLRHVPHCLLLVTMTTTPYPPFYVNLPKASQWTALYMYILHVHVQWVNLEWNLVISAIFLTKPWILPKSNVSSHDIWRIIIIIYMYNVCD